MQGLVMLRAWRVMRRARNLLALLACTVVPFCIAQSVATFEVATVRPVINGDPNEGYWSPPTSNSFKAHNLELTYLIRLAYGLQADSNAIEKKPAWMDSDLFDVSAKSREGVILTPEELQPRLQHLLQERFHLEAHFETRTVSGYELTVAKGGARLQPTKGAKFPNMRLEVYPGTMEGADWSSTFLAKALQAPVGKPVVDRTGLTLRFDIKMKYAKSPEDAELPSLFTALRESAGLELKPAKVPTQVLVIDHADRIPTEN